MNYSSNQIHWILESKGQPSKKVGKKQKSERRMKAVGKKIYSEE